MRAKRSLSKFSAFGLAQGVSSLSNFCLSLVITHTLPQDEFGSAAFALTFGFFAVSAQRAIVGDPAIAYRAEPPALLRSMGSILWLSAIVAGLLITGVFWPQLGRLASAIGIATILLVAQDGYRYVSAAAGRLRPVVVSDTVWLMLAAVATWGAARGGWTFGQAFGLWLIGAFVALGILVVTTRALVRPFGRIRQYFIATRELSGWAAIQFASSNGTMQATLSLVTVGIGLTNYAGLRAIQVVASPLQVAVLAMSSPLLALIASRGHTRGLRKRTAVLSLSVLAAISAFGALVWPFREAIVRVVVGETYVNYTHLLAPALLSIAFVGASLPVTAALQTLREGRRLFAVSTVAVVSSSAPIVIAAFYGALVQVAWLMAVQYLVIYVSLSIALAGVRVRPTIGLDDATEAR
jgi:O-antigen/teichoic acid export membrane protein